MDENAVARQIVDAAYRVHTTLGPGLLESVYEAALAYEWEKRGLRVSRQEPIPVVYEAVRIQTGFHADLLVEDQVIVEIKAVETIAPVHKKQLLTYLSRNHTLETIGQAIPPVCLPAQWLLALETFPHGIAPR